MDYKTFIKQVGLRLKERRKELGYTQNELIEELNKQFFKIDDDYISDKQLSRFESGNNATRLDKFVNLSLALGKTPDYFLLGIDNSNETKENKIKSINEYLLLFDEKDIDTILILVKAIYSNNK